MKIRYYTTRKAWPGSKTRWGYWAPCLKRRNKKTGEIEPTLMAKLGFRLTCCGPDGPLARAKAELLNAEWLKAREQYLNGEADASGVGKYVKGSVAEGFAKFRETQVWNVTMKPRTREDWWRGWKYIEPAFGNDLPRKLALEDLDAWYAELRGFLSVREAQRAMKIWRALWTKLAAMNAPDGQRYCGEVDPSAGVRVEEPKGRDKFWLYDEARVLVKTAWRMGYRGLAAALVVAWDTSLSPVDVRSVTLGQLRSDGRFGGKTGAAVLAIDPKAERPFFELRRTKTGKAAIATLSWRTQRLLRAYVVAGLPFELHPETPIFHTRGTPEGAIRGRPHRPKQYTRAMLGEDFRAVRAAAFPGDERTIADFRRSGSIEAAAGEVNQAALAAKLANNIDSNRKLQDTYTPHTAELVRLADHSREVGRPRLRGGGEKK